MGLRCYSIYTIATLISLSTILMEAKKQKTETLEQLTRMEGLLKEISRVRQPITELEITFWSELPNTIGVVQSYLTMLDKTIASRTEELRDAFRKNRDLDVTARGFNGEFWTVDVRQDSPYWPKGKNKVIGDVAKSFSFTIFIRKDPINPELFNPIMSTAPGFSDWIALPLPFDSKNHLSIDYKDKSLLVFGSTEYKKAFWKTNGKITSIQDLYGSQLFLLPPNTFNIELPPWLTKAEHSTNESKAFIQSVRMKNIVFKFSSGHEIWIDGARFRKTTYQGGSPVFSIILPKNEKELLDLERKD